ncbi:MAG: hypothetical protein AB7Q42_21255 [Acidimicrobiia bacterium]
MSDELPDPWGKPAYGGGASAPPPGTNPPRPPAPPTTAMPPTSSAPDPASMPTSAMPVTRPGGGAPPRGPIPPLGGDVPPPGDRRPLILGIVIGLVAALLIGLVAFVLTRDGDDSASELTDVSPVTTLTPDTLPQETTTSAVVEETTTIPTTTEVTTTTAPAPTTTVVDPTGWPSGLLLTVAANDGVHVVGPNGANTLVVPEAVEIALPIPGTDDFVVQTRSGRYSGATPEQTAIRRVGPGGAVVLIEPPTGVYLRLHDVRIVAGNLVVLYSTDVGDNPDTQVENLAQYRLGDGTVVNLGTIGGWEASTSRLKLGGVTAVGEFFAEASSGFMSVREDGTTIDPASIGLEDSYDDCGDCPRRFTITPNGQRLAWLDGNSLVVVDLGTGAEVQRAGVPGDIAASVADIIFSDGIAVLNRSSSGTTNGPFGNAVIVDLRGSAPVFIDVPIPGFVAR